MTSSVLHAGQEQKKVRPPLGLGGSRLLAPLTTTLLVVTFLFFIDEGYYNFNWMSDPGAWIVFSIYYAILFPVQWACSHFLFRSKRGISWVWLASAIGFFATLSLLFLITWLAGQA